MSYAVQRLSFSSGDLALALLLPSFILIHALKRRTCRGHTYPDTRTCVIGRGGSSWPKATHHYYAFIGDVFELAGEWGCSRADAGQYPLKDVLSRIIVGNCCVSGNSRCSLNRRLFVASPGKGERSGWLWLASICGPFRRRGFTRAANGDD